MKAFRQVLLTAGLCFCLLDVGGPCQAGCVDTNEPILKMTEPLRLEAALSAPRVYIYYLTGTATDPGGYIVETAPLEFPTWGQPVSIRFPYDKPEVQDFIRIVLTRPDLRERDYLARAMKDWNQFPDSMKDSLFDGFWKYLAEDYSGALKCFNVAVAKELPAVQRDPDNGYAVPKPSHNGYARILRAFTNFRLGNRAAAAIDYNDAFKYQWRVTTEEFHWVHRGVM